MSSTPASSSTTAPATSSSDSSSSNHEHVTKMTEMMAAEMRKMKAELEAERQRRAQIEQEHRTFVENKADAEAEKEKLRLENEQMNKRLDEIREEKRAKFANLLEKDIKPYFEKLRSAAGSDDQRLNESLDVMDTTLARGLADGFMDRESESTLRVVHAMASANRITSSDLEAVFQKNKAWENELVESRKLNEEQKEKLAAIEAEKEKQLAELREQLEKLRKQVASKDGSIADANAHFDKTEAESNAAVAATTSASASSSTPMSMDPAAAHGAAPGMAVTAMASNGRVAGGYDTLFQTSELTNWRSLYKPDIQS
eukprot:CAMPEP_0171493556 /NCGR_PEP_ID=MMETSP0958-20121227/5028_1 /TAXON_ID=87120 /ORGANISM="Aurantiochytrium limacinum, Strain ATCCMYA-1381" /LENGTH=313 /DNA_ID=CAMNT_0012027193 /DNA_START=107 /DNA_END=1045 /DNA_ORIENTATION=-